MDGMWSEAFERLHHAATHGASVEEVERLAAAELAELLAADDEHPATPGTNPEAPR